MGKVFVLLGLALLLNRCMFLHHLVVMEMEGIMENLRVQFGVVEQQINHPSTGFTLEYPIHCFS